MRMQDAILQALNQLTGIALLDGRLVENQDLIVGVTNVEHRLSRQPRGYIIVNQDGAAEIYATSLNAAYVSLNSDAAVTVSLWVF